MQVRVNRDERYPVYEIAENGAATLDVDDETAKRWRDAQEAWERVQDEIDDLARQNQDYYDGRYWHI